MRIAPLIVLLLFGAASTGCGPDGIDEPNAAFEQSAAADAGGGAGIEVVAAPVDEHAADDGHDDTTPAHDDDAVAHDDEMSDPVMTDAAHEDDAPHEDDTPHEDEAAHDDGMSDPVTTDEATPAPRSGIVIDVEMVEFGYVMEAATVPMGEPVTFRFTNTGDIEHEAMFGSPHQQEEYASAGGHGDAHGGGHHGDVAAVTVAAGESADLVLSFTEVGEMWIGCHIEGHWDAGMFTPFDVDG